MYTKLSPLNLSSFELMLYYNYNTRFRRWYYTYHHLIFCICWYFCTCRISNQSNICWIQWKMLFGFDIRHVQKYQQIQNEVSPIIINLCSIRIIHQKLKLKNKSHLLPSLYWILTIFILIKITKWSTMWIKEFNGIMKVFKDMNDSKL